MVPVATLWASSVSAHIRMSEPLPRYDAESNKSCPCGEGGSNRTCNTTAEETSDPNRSEGRVTQYEVGSTITVFFDEYINHSGRFRVAFDEDGADLADFNDNVLIDVADPNDAPGFRELMVTLPDTPCDNCTLQLIQAMHGDTVNPVDDPAPLSTYYTCADIQLVPVGQLGQDPVDDDVDPDPTDGDPTNGDAVESNPDEMGGSTNSSDMNNSLDGDLDSMVNDTSDDSNGMANTGDNDVDNGIDSGIDNGVDNATGGGALADTNAVEQPVVTGGAPIPEPAASGDGGCSISTDRSVSSRGAAPWSWAGLFVLLSLGFGRRFAGRKA